MQWLKTDEWVEVIMGEMIRKRRLKDCIVENVIFKMEPLMKSLEMIQIEQTI